MAYKIIRSEDSDHDLNLIFRHLVDSYVTLGDSLPDAFQRAIRRISAIEADMNVLAQTPHQGNLDPDLGPDLRHVTKNRAVFYFHIDDTAGIVRVVAIFFGGQDHQRRMLIRLRS
jgi:plasmid stabilization system protein ParE